MGVSNNVRGAPSGTRPRVSTGDGGRLAILEDMGAQLRLWRVAFLQRLHRHPALRTKRRAARRLGAMGQEQPPPLGRRGGGDDGVGIE